MKLPPDIEQIFFDTLSGDKTVLEFEEWLYADARLETILNSDDYLDLISYGYKEANAKYGLFKLLEKHIDKGEFEKRRILRLLTKALNRDKRLPEILVTFYDLYCKGYSFLYNLGMGFGLEVEVPRVENTTADFWEELNEKQQTELLQSFYPALERELKKTISWIVDGKVVLTGVKDKYNYFEYIDNRTETEKIVSCRMSDIRNNDQD